MYRRLRWLAVVAGVLVIAAAEVVADAILDASLRFPFDTLIVVAVVAVVAFVAASLDFRQIDRLTGDVLARNRELESRNAALRAVYDVSLAVAARKDPGQTIDGILRRARELLSMDAAMLVVQRPDGENRVAASSAVQGALREAHPAEDRRVGQAGSFDPGDVLRAGIEVRISAPVVLGDSREGTLDLASRRDRRFTETELGTVSALATQIGLAIEAARLQHELQALAVQGERERIAREMHDGLAQVLAYVNTKSQAVDEMLADGRIPDARRQLGELAAAARSLYVDVREAILTLSAPVGPDRSVIAALEEYAALYAESSKLAVRLEVTPAARTAPLSVAAQTEVFRIAREALTNVRKHAGARRVRLRLSTEDGVAVLLVEDDGVGFDAAALTRAPERWPHFGLAGMRERAESVGGTIVWHSAPGHGTTVELRVPTGWAISGGGTFLAGPVPATPPITTAPLGETNPPPGPHQAGRSTDGPASEAD